MNSSTPAPARRAATDRASPAQRHRGGLIGAAAPAAADELPTFTLTFKPNGTFEPATLEVPAGRFKIELINESNEPVEFESIPLRKEKCWAGREILRGDHDLPSRRVSVFDDFHQNVKGTLVVKPKE